MLQLVALYISLTVCLVIVPPVLAEEQGTGQAIYEAALFQDLPKLQQLLAKPGAAVNHLENGRPILGWAAQSGNVEIVNALLKAGANPNIADEGIGHTPLMRAIETQNIEITKTLLAAKANPNAKASDGDSCLMMAVKTYKPEFVQALVDAGADAKEVQEDGDSLVLQAAQDGQPGSLEIIKILAKAGAPMDTANAAYTPLIYAVQQGNKELVKTLLDAGAKPGAETPLGSTSIRYALDNADVLALLIEAKADINTVNSSGNTLLIDALQNSQLESAKVLINAGADLSRADSYGNTPLQVAEQYSHTEIVELIKKKSGAAAPAKQGDEYAAFDATPRADGECTIVDAARKQMEIQGLLQAQVNAGKMSDDIFRTFNEDTTEYARLLTEDPPAACRLLEKLRAKYGV